MRRRRSRELTAVALWALAAVAWVVAVSVPWFRAGVPASTSPLAVGELVRTGVLGVPPVAGYLVLVLPASALVLLGIAPLRGPGALALRVVLWLVGAGVGLTLVFVLGRVSAFAVGWGAALVVVATVLGAVALAFSTVRPAAVR
ncbi:hypothetical protein ABFT23_04295 [Nocardioides sp. C4-1]|uniref:hypothetical protein n=1 Tax=Nocardioides sp. C4-1 TaxID=3151851 RepID=UPI0032639645